MCAKGNLPCSVTGGGDDSVVSGSGSFESHAKLLHWVQTNERNEDNRLNALSNDDD